MDSLGPVKVSAEAYWGAQTQRAIENFPISGLRMPTALYAGAGDHQKSLGADQS